MSTNLHERLADTGWDVISGLAVTVAWAVIAAVYLFIKDKRNEMRLREYFTSPHRVMVGIGADCIVLTLSNPISRPIEVDRITIVCANPEHMIAMVRNDEPEKGAQQVPCPCRIVLRCHGRDILPTATDDIAHDVPRVSLIPHETHTWWALSLREAGDAWFERLTLTGIDYEVIYHSHIRGSQRMEFSASKAAIEALRKMKEDHSKHKGRK